MIHRDKKLHFGVSLAIALQGTIPCVVTQTEWLWWLMLAVAFLWGIGKECWDKFVQKESFDLADLFADFLGVIAGGVLLPGLVMIWLR